MAGAIGPGTISRTYQEPHYDSVQATVATTDA